MIIGIIGSLICVYSVGYMKTYQLQHKEVPDRRGFFFAILFVFLAAMFGLVFSNNLMWVFFFWEITTICSFLLIGYSKTEEATTNSFLALSMNLLGGVAFIAAIIYLVMSDPSGKLLSLNYLLASSKAVALVPAVLICFAGITKAALMPFSSWLVGAMVAPTPVSALLHSSTMVKAGVYIIVRFAPVLSGTTEGLIIALVGGLTFLLASCMAISQHNAKKVLAYSTIANLGLIVACAGVGTYNLMWVAILLIIFHAIAKSLLFLCVGTIEQRIGSRDIEDMGGLIVRMPKIAIMMFIGMAGMFLAPFGMVISKWAAIEAFIIAPFGLIFIAILAFGGSVTVFFWCKWMGKIISVMRNQTVIEGTGKKEDYGVLYILTGLVVVVCLIFPLISSTLIEPFVLNIYGQTTRLAQANLTIMVMMLCLLMIMPFSMLFYRKGVTPATPYMGGVPMNDPMHYAGSMGVSRELVLSNYYLEKTFGEERLFMVGAAVCWALLLVAGILLLGVIL
jgi:ech hydrogenase subunit A